MALWRKVADGVDRRLSDERLTRREPTSSELRRSTTPKTSSPKTTSTLAREPAPPSAPKPQIRLKPQGPIEPRTQLTRAEKPLGHLKDVGDGLGRRAARGLERGNRDPDATFDLHGLTQERAHRALLTFLRREQAAGSTVVCVITGKGGRRDDGQDWGGGEGVLRRAVRLWLKEAPFAAIVATAAEAPRNRGGGGALYLRLRKKR